MDGNSSSNALYGTPRFAFAAPDRSPAAAMAEVLRAKARDEAMRRPDLDERDCSRCQCAVGTAAICSVCGRVQ